MKPVILIITSITLILGIVVFFMFPADPCSKLDPCAQYQCRNPEFYCAGTLYESNTPPQDIEDAQRIVLSYISNELGLESEVLFSAQSSYTPAWYQVTCRLSNGTEYGYDVGPDGNIYQIKRRN